MNNQIILSTLKRMLEAFEIVALNEQHVRDIQSAIPYHDMRGLQITKLGLMRGIAYECERIGLELDPIIRGLEQTLND